MSIFLSLLSKLFPLYATMGAGAALSRRAGNLTASLATLQLYFIAPVVVFANILKLQIVPELAFLPILYFALCATVSATTYNLSRKIGTDYAPVLGQASGGANTGYLGVPIATILFPPEWVPIYFFVMVGGMLYENTVGYYWIARGHFSARDAVKSLLKLPTFHALLLGLLGNALGLQMPEMWTNVVRDFMGAYVVLGALIIGFAIAQNKSFAFNFRFMGALLGIKFLLWPLLMVGVVQALRGLGLGVPVSGEHILLLLGILPLAANSAAFAALLKIHPEETATVVALSTALSLFIVPLYVVLFGLA